MRLDKAWVGAIPGTVLGKSGGTWVRGVLGTSAEAQSQPCPALWITKSVVHLLDSWFGGSSWGVQLSL